MAEQPVFRAGSGLQNLTSAHHSGTASSAVDRDRHRFWFPGGLYFDIAPWDGDVAADWCWDCHGDDFVVYDDHPGWYLVCNVPTGPYVHAQYMGS